MSRFPKEQQIEALWFMTKREQHILLIGARDAFRFVAGKFLMPGLPELKRLERISTMEDYFFTFAQWAIAKSEVLKTVHKEAVDRSDVLFLKQAANYLSQKEVPIPLAELWLASFWIRPGKASFYENLCLWTDKALTDYFKAMSISKCSEASLRKMRQRLKLKKSKSIVINGYGKKPGRKGYRLFFKK